MGHTLRSFGLEVVGEGGDEGGRDAELADLLQLELLPEAVCVRGQLLALLHGQLRPRQAWEHERTGRLLCLRWSPLATLFSCINQHILFVRRSYQLGRCRGGGAVTQGEEAVGRGDAEAR
jgi:hypothetical protein